MAMSSVVLHEPLRPRFPTGVPSAANDRVCVVPTADRSTAVIEGFDDVMLLGRIASQDRKAFRVFYQRHAARLLGALRRLCNDKALADDLLQEVFLQVWRKAGSYRSTRGDVGGWLFTITRNKVIDHRRRGVLPVDDDADLSRKPSPPAGATQEVSISLQRALGQLTEDQRRAVSMTYLGGFTYDETAARLRVPLGTLKSRLRTGIRALRAHLENG